MTDFEAYLINIGKSAKTAKNYAGAISGPISAWTAEHSLTALPLVEHDELVEFEKIALQIRELEIYKSRNHVGNGMYNAALNAFAQFIAESRGVYLEQDLEEIIADKTTTNTEKQQLVNTRIGQGKFRRNLVEYWQGCAVTGYSGTRLLVASHIKPWRLSNHQERLDPFNGLLLLPNLDKAFDLGYISFESTGQVCISTELEEPNILGVHENLKIKLENKHHDYLDIHLRQIFLG